MGKDVNPDNTGMLAWLAGEQVSERVSFAGQHAGELIDQLERKHQLTQKLTRNARWEARQRANKQAVELASEREPAGPALADTAGRAMLRFMLDVRSRLPRCEVYFKIVDTSSSTFKIEVLAFVEVNGDRFATAFRTSHISTNVSKSKLDEEIDTIVAAVGAYEVDVVGQFFGLGISKVLGVSVFTGRSDAIPPNALKMFVEPA